MIKNYAIFGCIIIFLNLVLISLQLQEEKFDDPKSVVLVNIVFRHGDRNPVDLYPTDPYKNMSYWKEGLGQLTDVGKQQHYQFGQYLRKRYGGLLPAIYNLRDIKVQSTDVDRTLMSAESNLAGLYPPVNPWHEGLQWQPIPVHTTPEKMDRLIAMKHPCPHYDEEYRRVMESPEIRRVNEEHRGLYDYVSKHSGEEIRDPIRLQWLFNTFYIEQLKNLALPEWTKKVFPDQMTGMSAFSFTLAAYNKVLQRLRGGPLVGEMVKHMVEKSKATLEPDRKMFVYSAHDTTVSNLLMTLGVFDAQTPPYTAAVFVELHHLPENQYAVSVLLRNDSSRAPVPLILPGCTFRCPLDTFVSLTNPIIPEDWMAECGLQSEIQTLESKLLENLTIAVVIGSGLIALLLVVLFVIAVMYWQHRSDAPIYSRLRTDGP